MLRWQFLLLVTQPGTINCLRLVAVNNCTAGLAASLLPVITHEWKRAKV